MSEEKIKEYREKIDKMKEAILTQGHYPVAMAVGMGDMEERVIWMAAILELEADGRLPSMQ